MSADVWAYLPELSGWGVVGFAVGFVAKKLLKIILIAVGIYFATLLYLQQQGLITINDGLEGSLDSLAGVLFDRAGAFWATAAISLPLVGAFGVGAYLGFRKG
jgi:uncharacterized membrane protein (Fun14 family)